jgi:phage head maturation protease
MVRFHQGKGNNYTCLTVLNINALTLTSNLNVTYVTLPAYRDTSVEAINPQNVNNY